MISVTAEHIAAGKPNDACWCPVWHAIRAAFPDADAAGIAVGPDAFTVCSHAVVSDVEFPDAAARFIRRYDKGETVQPFTFTLDIPGWLHALYRPAVSNG